MDNILHPHTVKVLSKKYDRPSQNVITWNYKMVHKFGQCMDMVFSEPVLIRLHISTMNNIGLFLYEYNLRKDTNYFPLFAMHFEGNFSFFSSQNQPCFAISMRNRELLGLQQCVSIHCRSYSIGSRESLLIFLKESKDMLFQKSAFRSCIQINGTLVLKKARLS